MSSSRGFAGTAWLPAHWHHPGEGRETQAPLPAFQAQPSSPRVKFG
jgi:hypothetical protein